MQIGRYHQLRATRFTDFGVFLENEEKEDVLLPRKFVPQSLKTGEEVRVFVYLDNEERLTATTQEPRMQLGEFAHLPVAQVSRIGAFVDWGLDKQLLVPFIEQKERMQEGKYYMIYLYEDKLTHRLAGSSKVKQFLQAPPETLKANQETEGLVYRHTELGVEVIVAHSFLGLLYHNELLRKLEVGEKLKVYVKKVREDGKVDLSLKPGGYQNHIDADCALLLRTLEANAGFLDLHDKSDPDEIATRLHLSKKAFKKAVGKLYREKRIRLEETGIRLNH